jgi:hypothetical protein
VVIAGADTWGGGGGGPPAPPPKNGKKNILGGKNGVFSNKNPQKKLKGPPPFISQIDVKICILMRDSFVPLNPMFSRDFKSSCQANESKICFINNNPDDLFNITAMIGSI